MNSTFAVAEFPSKIWWNKMQKAIEIEGSEIYQKHTAVFQKSLMFIDKQCLYVLGIGAFSWTVCLTPFTLTFDLIVGLFNCIYCLLAYRTKCKPEISHLFRQRIMPFLKQHLTFFFSILRNSFLVYPFKMITKQLPSLYILTLAIKAFMLILLENASFSSLFSSLLLFSVSWVYPIIFCLSLFMYFPLIYYTAQEKAKMVLDFSNTGKGISNFQLNQFVKSHLYPDTVNPGTARPNTEIPTSFNTSPMHAFEEDWFSSTSQNSIPTQSVSGISIYLTVYMLIIQNIFVEGNAPN